MKSQILTESQELRLKNKQLQMKISGMEASQEKLDNSVQSLLKDIEGKNKELRELQETLDKERNEKSVLADQYVMKIQDRGEMNDTLQREVELLKAELDQQLTSSNIMKNDLEVRLRERETGLLALNEEKTKLEQACQKYETEIRDRIKENLDIMDDYDNAKAVELKQLNLINEITKSNQELTSTARKQQKELNELKAKLQEMESEIHDETKSSIETSNSLDAVEKKNQKLEEAMQQAIEALTDKDDVIARLVKHKNELEAKLQEASEASDVASMARDQYKEKLKEFENYQQQTADQFQKEKENFDKRDKEQTEFLNQLVRDLENCKEKLLEKTQMIHDIGVELTNEMDQNKSTSQSQLAIINDLKQKLIEAENQLTSKDGNIKKLSEENRYINDKLIQKLETLETLKLENNNWDRKSVV